MSQTQPEPLEPESSASPAPAEVSDEATIILPTTPETPPPPPPPFVPVKPQGPDLRAASLDWMQKSQEITAKLLYDLGGWVFGGLIVAALMLLPALIGLGFADRATLIAGLFLAIALPFNLAGLGIIRYFNVLNQAIEEARLALGQNPNLDAETLTRLTQESSSFSLRKHQVMDSSLALTLYLSLLFTIIGSCAALWRISWAVVLFFLIACVVGGFLVLRVIRSS